MGRPSKNIEEQYCGKMFSRKVGNEFGKWDIYSAISAGWILHQMSAHEILVNSGPTMLEKYTIVCLCFSKGQHICIYIYLGTEYIFLATIFGVPFIF